MVASLNKLLVVSTLVMIGLVAVSSAALAWPRAWTSDDLFAAPDLYAQGHRGYGANDFDPNPPGENTLEGFRRAFRDGIRVVELDLQQTADGKIVVIHDDYLLPDYACIHSLTYGQLLARRPEVPLFRSVLAESRHFSQRACLSGLIFAEIKVPVPLCDGSNTSEQALVTESALVAAVVQDIERARMEDQVILNSGSPSILARVREQAPGIARVLTLNALQLLSPAEACAVLGPGLCPVKIAKNDCGLDWYNIGPIARLPAFPGANASQRYGGFLGAALGCAGAREVALDKGALLPAGAAGAAQLVAAAHGVGLEVDVWTVDTQSEWDFVAAAGVDAITTNNIAMALASQAPVACRAHDCWPRHGNDREDGDDADVQASGSEIEAVSAARPALALSAGHTSGSSDGSMRLDFSLRSSGPAEIGVFDIAGRKLDSREVGSMGAGQHQIGMGRDLQPGIYLVRLITPDEQARTKVIVTR